MTSKPRTFTGTCDPAPQPYEAAHREVARMAADEGIVLLKNEDHILPLQAGTALALYGRGADLTVKGGTGSGDVNERDSVSICKGLKAAGFSVTTERWIEAYAAEYAGARNVWRDKVWEKAGNGDLIHLFTAYASTPFSAPAGPMPADGDGTETAVYVLSRLAGEGADRYAAKGDYYLSDEEAAQLNAICRIYPKVILLINAGGPVDLGFLDTCPRIKAVVQLSQLGMEGGNAAADVLSGKVTPSGKLTDTWALRYEDYPNAKTFSHNNGNVKQELYTEGIYVGYRYFDTFGIPVRYGFGYGLSYTDFRMELENVRVDGGEAYVRVSVKNRGEQYSGREVVQVYVSAPQNGQDKEYRRLAGFAKSPLLAPGQSETCEIHFPLYQLASYRERTADWVLDGGTYGIFVGASLDASRHVANLVLDADAALVHTAHICPLRQELEECRAPAALLEEKRAAWLQEACPTIALHAAAFPTRVVRYGADAQTDPKAAAFADNLTTEQLILLATGDPGKGQGSNLGSSGISVPGSAAQTSACAMAQGLDDLTLADGPAGLRLQKQYTVCEGKIIPQSFLASLENGFLEKESRTAISGDTYYQFCTAFPVGTAVAQSWNRALAADIGRAVAEEMQRFQIALWLAPGMNIHRNPLCGRNFEYYSEDPVLSGEMAAAITGGVQSKTGCGTTIKHFACNNQEDNRMGSDSILSERALREIYLKGFEIAVCKAQPFAIMTSYNKINGVHAANCADLCTKVAREEWGFEGVVMTDWTTTHDDPECTASGCMRAGNDLVMPGIPADHENMRQELAAGTLNAAALKRSAAHLIHVIWKAGR